MQITEQIQTLKNQAIELYNKLNQESKNITSQYKFNLEIDELTKLILDIIYYKEISNNHLEENEPTPYKRELIEKQNLKEIKKLTKKKKTIINTLAVIETATKEISTNHHFLRLKNKLDMEYFRAKMQLERINSELKVYEGNPDLSDGEINLYIINEKDLHFNCDIYLANTPIYIGNIEYRGPNNHPWIGDIGYSITPQYQGHNYSYKALLLIKEKIINLGIQEVIITTDYRNIASQKIIEKFGGILTNEKNGVLRYTCSLTKELKEENSLKIKN